jgi:hypothetical protein
MSLLLLTTHLVPPLAVGGVVFVVPVVGVVIGLSVQA